MYVSVLIPTFNACERLYYNLISLSFQSYPSNMFEVVIIDDGSNDGTYKMISNFKSAFKMKYIRLKSNKGRSSARNIGINESKGDIVIFHDSDMIASNDFIQRHVEAHTDDKIVVCGPSWKKIFSYYYDNLNHFQAGKFREFVDKLYLNNESFSNKHPLISIKNIEDGTYIKHVFEDESRKNLFDKIVGKYSKDMNDYYLPWRLFITNNCSVNKKSIIDVGLFDENYKGWGCEDYDLGFRLYKHGCNFIVKDQILSIHQEHPTNPKDTGIKNIIYFCEKYDFIDVKLLYFIKLTTIDKSWLNDIIKEANVLESDQAYLKLLTLYKNLLKRLISRYKMNKPITSNIGIKDIEEALIKDEIENLVQKAYVEHGFTYIGKSLSVLIKDLFGANIDFFKLNS